MPKKEKTEWKNKKTGGRDEEGMAGQQKTQNRLNSTRPRHRLPNATVFCRVRQKQTEKASVCVPSKRLRFQSRSCMRTWPRFSEALLSLSLFLRTILSLSPFFLEANLVKRAVSHTIVAFCLSTYYTTPVLWIKTFSKLIFEHFPSFVLLIFSLSPFMFLELLW